MPSLFRKFFDAFPRSRYLISDFEALTRVIEILDDDELFIHGVFLLSKVNVRILNEIHIRLILEKYDIFIKKKLLLLTYTLNPLMVRINYRILQKTNDEIKKLYEKETTVTNYYVQKDGSIARLSDAAAFSLFTTNTRELLQKDYDQEYRFITSVSGRSQRVE